jgi:cell division protein FtsI (penicillin-binding protein 3)
MEPRGAEPGGGVGEPRGRGGIGDARSYTPRGRTVREQAEQRPAAEQRRGQRARTGDPFRPALQVLDGGREGPPRRATRAPGDPGGARRGTAASARGSSGAAGGSVRAAAGSVRTAGADRSAAGRNTGARSGGGRSTGRTAAGAGRTLGRTGASGRGGVPAQRRTRATAAGSGGRRPPGRLRTPPRPPRPPRLGEPRRRLRLATVLALTLFAVLGIRLITLQVTEAPAYALAGLQKRLATVVLTAPRGAIVDRSGAVLAHSVEARYVYADPTLVENPARVAEALSPELGLAKSELLPRLVRQKRPDGRESQFEYLQRGVSIATADKIMAMNLPGINVGPDERREVPGHDVAANLIGFTGLDLNGLEGMEARYDELLRGRDGELVYEHGQGEDLFAEIPGGYRRERPAQPGSSLRLTIDRDVQYAVQRVLYDKMRAVRATYGAAVVLDARSGEVVAQASYPTYDAADPLKYKPREREDVATSVVVDPGSVHKALVIGAALEEGVIKPETRLVIGPTIRKGDTVFRDTHPNYKPRAMSLPGILAFSSNVGTIKIADLLGDQKLYDYQVRFGLGRATGVGVPGEAQGLVQPPRNWSGSSHGSIPIGHGVAVTPLQMAAAYGAIANDGTWVQPHLIQAVIDPDGTEHEAGAPQRRQVLSPDNAAALRRMMEAVVTVRNATGTTARVDNYRVAGKTGTGAQVVGGRYVAGEVASFVGMAPADNPRFVVAVFAHTPGGGGGVIAGPAFREIMAYALGRFKVPPTGTKPPTFVVYP